MQYSDKITTIKAMDEIIDGIEKQRLALAPESNNFEVLANTRPGFHFLAWPKKQESGNHSSVTILIEDGMAVFDINTSAEEAELHAEVLVDIQRWIDVGGIEKDINKVSDYIQGRLDCEAGKLCPQNSSKDYESGYSDQYIKEQSDQGVENEIIS